MSRQKIKKVSKSTSEEGVKRMFKCFNVKGNEYPPSPSAGIPSLFYQKQIVTNILEYLNCTCIQLQGGLEVYLTLPFPPGTFNSFNQGCNPPPVHLIHQLKSGVQTPSPITLKTPALIKGVYSLPPP